MRRRRLDHWLLVWATLAAVCVGATAVSRIEPRRDGLQCTEPLPTYLWALSDDRRDPWCATATARVMADDLSQALESLLGQCRSPGYDTGAIASYATSTPTGRSCACNTAAWQLASACATSAISQKPS